MKANAIALLDIFEAKQRLEVPLFQRQYVWDQGRQWEPLWEDIARKFEDAVEGRTDAPVHFLGAMVLDQKQTPTTHVIRRQIIDGQQRLTTLQIFLAAFRDYARFVHVPEIGDECDTYIFNRGMMADPEVDKFKVWPTRADREQFMDVMTSGDIFELDKRHPVVYKKYARKPEPRPRMVDAYHFFWDRMIEFFEPDRQEHLEACFHVMKDGLQVVVIDLEASDDAQVIFETLNARGEPLLPADLLRNYIFLRAARREEDQERLYHSYWEPFDEDFWRVETRQGRLIRPRSDLFMQHFLTSQTQLDIPVKHLYVEYRHWIERRQPFATVEDELKVIASSREVFRKLIAAPPSDPLYRLSRFLRIFDVSTVYPLILWFLSVPRSHGDILALTEALESYFVRRAVCDLTGKSLNRVFLRATTHLASLAAATVDDVVAYLASLTGESSEWPSDRKFAESWMSTPAYSVTYQERLVYILSRLNESMHGSKSELVDVQSELTIEHIMPRAWEEHWPLMTGEPGMTFEERWDADEDDPRRLASERRDAILDTLGNLTILTQPLNSAASNSGWSSKRPEILTHSVLPINTVLNQLDVWDEKTIEQRGKQLFERALRLWPRPTQSPSG